MSEEAQRALDDAAAQSGAQSKNAFVEQIVIQAAGDLRRSERRRRWEEAMRDPLFLRDVQEVETAFAGADAETARQID